jgi:hypothetical protein
MPSAGFEPTIPALERAKTVHTLYRTAKHYMSTTHKNVQNNIHHNE